ncbi:MAG: metallophosphoesterase [Bryobacteraceae bacterium]
MAVQLLIARQLYLFLARRSSRGAALTFALLYVVALLLGISLGFTHLRLVRYVPRPVSAIMGGLTHLWSYTSSAAYVVHAVFRFLSRRLPSARFDPARRRLLNIAGGAAAAVPFAVVGYGALVERTRFRVKEVDVPLPELPRDLDGLRLVQLSDIHLSMFLSEQEFARAIDEANQLRAHLMLVTGDLISARGDPLDACLRQIARLRADAGIFGCLGNHEAYAAAQNYATGQGRRLGIRFLRQEAAGLRFGSAVLNLAGVDHQRMSPRHPEAYLPHAERLVAPGAVNVLLSHNPDVIPVAAQKGFHLTLSGHTHGGQVTVEIMDQSINPARFITPYVYGLFQEGNHAAYVTRGIGTIGIPARIGAPPEIALLRLRRV